MVGGSTGCNGSGGMAAPVWSPRHATGSGILHCQSTRHVGATVMLAQSTDSRTIVAAAATRVVSADSAITSADVIEMIGNSGDPRAAGRLQRAKNSRACSQIIERLTTNQSLTMTFFTMPPPTDMMHHPQ